MATAKRKVCKNAGDDERHAKRPANHPGPRCTTCHREARREATAGRHEAYVGKTYGLRPGEYAAILAYQGGKCAICQRATGAVRRLAVDHDHAIEKVSGSRASVRGILCKTCNTILGRFRDDVDTFERAINYLINPPAWEVLRESDKARRSAPSGGGGGGLPAACPGAQLDPDPRDDGSGSPDSSALGSKP